MAITASLQVPVAAAPAGAKARARANAAARASAAPAARAAAVTPQLRGAAAAIPTCVRGSRAARASARSVVYVAAKTTIVDAAVADPQFSILVEAVTKAGLAGALSGDGPFTVFAPTNDAFVKALGALKLTKAELLALPNLADILKYHVVSGKVMSSQLSNGMSAPTLQGSKITFDLTNGVKVSGSNVIKADVGVDNGVIHVIDTVMLPPAAPVNEKAAAKKYIESSAGVTLPFGFFDPLGFASDKTMDEVKRLRESEIVHGRVAMLAAVGFIVGENFAPLYNGSITGLAANQFQQVPDPFWEILITAIGIAEAGRAVKGWQEPGGETFLRPSYNPGELGFDPLGLKPTNAAEYKDMATKEVNNGRLAMLAIAGFVAQEEVTKMPIMESIFQ